jgi:hypothetical protein
MSLDSIYLALIAKKAEQVILKTGFKNVLSLANKLSKGVRRHKKALIFKACYLALKNLDMNYLSSNKKIVFSVIRKKSIFDESKMITFFHILTGCEFIPLSKRYKVMPYDKNEIIDLMKKYNFNVTFVRG